MITRLYQHIHAVDFSWYICYAEQILHELYSHIFLVPQPRCHLLFIYRVDKQISSISALLSVASLHHFQFTIPFTFILYIYVAVNFTITLFVNIYTVTSYQSFGLQPPCPKTAGAGQMQVLSQRFWCHSQTRPSRHCKFWQSPREIVKKLRFGMKHVMGRQDHQFVLKTNLIAIHISHLHFSHFPLASGLESGCRHGFSWF